MISQYVADLTYRVESSRSSPRDDRSVIRVAAGGMPTAELTRQSLADPRRVLTGLPAFAFCLLFCFQGTVWNAPYAGVLPERSVDSVAFPVAIASVKRVVKLTPPLKAHNLASGKDPDQVVQLLPTA